MRERPILFSAPMVRALLDGSKTQTRRLMKPQPIPFGSVGGLSLPGFCCILETGFRRSAPIFKSKFGQPGDRLWVRESHWYFKDSYDHETGYFPPPLTLDDFEYRADGESDRHGWYPSIHMPRVGSRITLEITGVRVERLQDISRGDAMAEGCPFPNMAQGTDPRQWYAELWEQINGPGSWGKNPWLWVVDFKVETP